MKNLKLESAIAVTWNNTRSTSKTSIMTAQIKELYKDFNNESFDISYEYVDEDGEVYGSDKETFTDVESDDLYEIVKSDLPDIGAEGNAKVEMYKYYEALRYKMAERFSELTKEAINIVVA